MYTTSTKVDLTIPGVGVVAGAEVTVVVSETNR